MSLNSNKLVDKMDEKAIQYLGPDYLLIRDSMKERLFKVISEAVIEHIKENAEVKVFIVGTDSGATLIPLRDRFIARGDINVPAPSPGTDLLPLIPDFGLQTSTAPPGPTAPDLTTKLLTTPGFID